MHRTRFRFVQDSRPSIVARLLGLAFLIVYLSFPAIRDSLAKETSTDRSTYAANVEVSVSKKTGRANYSRATLIRDELLRADSDVVLVVAHRGDWRNAPENSLQAIKNSIEMGVDIVEIDVRKTKDGHLVLMHDKTLDRTTTGTGNVSDHTLAELTELYLRNGQGRATLHRIPTLKEAMLVAKGNIMINLDKCYGLFAEAFAVLEETGTVDHAIIKGKVTLEQARKDFGQYLDQVIFMPVVDIDDRKAAETVESYVQDLAPVAFEFVFEHETPDLEERFRQLRNKGSRIWVNTLWPELSGGHDDDLAVKDIEKSYGWIVDSGVNLIQTDRPALLLEYLDSRDLRHKDSSVSVSLAPSRN